MPTLIRDSMGRLATSSQAAPAATVTPPAPAAAVTADVAITLGFDSAEAPITLADVKKRGLSELARVVKYTDVGAAARDDLLSFKLEAQAKAAGLSKVPDLPILRAAIERGIAGWTGSPWQATVEEGIRAEIENLVIAEKDKMRSAPGTKGLPPALAPGSGALRKKAPAELVARAAALAIDVDQVEASALAAKMNPMKALEAEIWNQELAARDRSRAL